MATCCRPSQRDDDRTHTVRYWQAYYDGDPGAEPVMEDHGTFDIACTHNDAVSLAAVHAHRVQATHSIGMTESTPGRWRAHDYERGEGTKFEVYVYRGPAEEDYDQERQS